MVVKSKPAALICCDDGAVRGRGGEVGEGGGRGGEMGSEGQNEMAADLAQQLQLDSDNVSYFICYKI